MLQAAVACLAGLVFGLGLIVSGMGDPAKVQDFLDVFGRWDPSLALVMGGAIGVALLAFAWAKKRTRSALGLPMQLPTATVIDKRLLAGAALFGVGWGLAGLCPGPAVMSVATGALEALLFVVAMLVGMLAQHWWSQRP